MVLSLTRGWDVGTLIIGRAGREALWTLQDVSWSTRRPVYTVCQK